MTSRYCSATLLANVGIPVGWITPHAIMHYKFIVVDGETVETASFNFTSSAESRNAENVLVLHDATVAAQYGQEWEQLWDEPQGMTKRY